MSTVLDLFCGAGGATRGYQLAGHTVYGIDIAPQPNYCGDAFAQGDALAWLRALAAGRGVVFEQGPTAIMMTLHDIDFIHASPPCQGYSRAVPIGKEKYPRLIADTRLELTCVTQPYVIENVPDASRRMRNPRTLCGCMFEELPGIYRSRLFETGNGFSFNEMRCRPHTQAISKMGRPPRPNERMHIVGNFSDIAEGRRRMGIDWMTRAELTEAIPPAYTKYIGGFIK